jgi:hypothetical protein
MVVEVFSLVIVLEYLIKVNITSPASMPILASHLRDVLVIVYSSVFLLQLHSLHLLDSWKAVKDQPLHLTIHMHFSFASDGHSQFLTCCV